MVSERGMTLDLDQGPGLLLYQPLTSIRVFDALGSSCMKFGCRRRSKPPPAGNLTGDSTTPPLATLPAIPSSGNHTIMNLPPMTTIPSDLLPHDSSSTKKVHQRPWSRPSRSAHIVDLNMCHCLSSMPEGYSRQQASAPFRMPVFLITPANLSFSVRSHALRPKSARTQTARSIVSAHRIQIASASLSIPTNSRHLPLILTSNPSLKLLRSVNRSAAWISRSLSISDCDVPRTISYSISRRSRSLRLSHYLYAKSLSLRSGSLRNLSYQYSSGADGRIEMVSNEDNDRKYPAFDGYFFKLLKLNAPEWPYAILGTVGSIFSGVIGPTFAIVMSNMIKGLRNEVGWFEEKENNSSNKAARLTTDAADVKSLFVGTIFDNTTYGKYITTEEEVIDVARAANVHGFLSELPDGYKTHVGERGVQLSGE